MSKFSKKQLLEEFALFEDFESKAQAERSFDHLLGIIKGQLTAGNSVALGQDFGEFKVATQAARTGAINDVTYDTPAKQVVKFTVSAPFKRAVAGN